MIPWLSDDDPFPPVTQALQINDVAPGLLAASPYLTVSRLVQAYHQGIFPWYSEGQAVLWWSPDPRMVLMPSKFRASHSLRKLIRQVLRRDEWEIYIDRDFQGVMQSCANIQRPSQNGTWITQAILATYYTLHQQNQAHSIEIYYAGQQIAGLYGVALGRMFFGESMFTRYPNASKLALAALCAFLKRSQVHLMDCQQASSHLASLGAFTIPRKKFITHVNQTVGQPPITNWQLDKTILQDWIADTTDDKI